MTHHGGDVLELILRKSASPRRLAPVGLVAVSAGLVTGIATAAATPAYAVAGIVGLLALAALLASSHLGLLAFIGVVSVLPFGVVPVQLGLVKLTFLDFVLVALLLAWISRLLTTYGERFRAGPLGGLLLVFILLALVSFAAGTAYAVTAETTRLFLKIVNSILVYFTVLNCVRTRRLLDQLVAALLVAGAAAGILALTLYYIPTSSSTRFFSMLRPFGYPSGDVLRYIADTDVQRAIGTAIDPNILGAFLMLVMTVAVGQVLSARAVFSRRLLVVLIVPLFAAQLLTYSRSSWMGLAVACMFIGTLRYRRLWLAFALVAVALYFGILPQGEGFVGHLESGLQAQDQAAAMRLGEYSDALRLIGQYPWFGVGFGSAPTIDLYVGVSNIYLLIAEEMGLIGLGVFLAIMVAFFRHTTRALPKIADQGIQSILLSAMAAVLAALVAGVFDHHFFNLRFPHTVALLWFFVGLAVVAAQLGTSKGDSSGADVPHVIPGA